MTGEWHKLAASDGTEVPVRVVEATDSPKAYFLLLPALGIPARFYRRLAEGLASEGVSTILLEQRGHGESPHKPVRGSKFGYSDFLDVDIAAAREWAQEQAAGSLFFLGGHSLGGHLSSIAAGRDSEGIDGVVHIACGFPYTGLYTRSAAKKIRTLCWLIPPLCLFFGYFPGNRVGFGGREYTRLMLDWRDWALHGTYDYGDVTGVEEDIARYKGRVLSISFEKDFFASDLAVEYSHSRLKNATVTTMKLGEAEQGKHLGHFDWARNPVGAVAAITNWMASGR
ncbi:alpha/beta hydrolase family protein [Kordiimonas aestuarii]|uniref:alpha/beta hydrolase family protein n=1 Tax=Kordiimonas aestuarii TaxID=1005925 RepID=UPI0021D21733|nr:alpha/beta fold hydrolase [Kordiimonas aestuarii]